MSTEPTHLPSKKIRCATSVTGPKTFQRNLNLNNEFHVFPTSTHNNINKNFIVN